MDNPIEQSEHGAEAIEKSAGSRRRPWHVPQFILTEISHTDNQAGALNDGGLASSS
jgi:hypothetical protein